MTEQEEDFDAWHTLVANFLRSIQAASKRRLVQQLRDFDEFANSTEYEEYRPS